MSVVVTRGRPAEDGAERADAEVRVEGRVAARERWTAPGAPELEVVRVEGSGPAGLDPASGQECRVRVRVRGRAQRVTLTVSLPEGTRDERVTFYRDARLDTQRIAVVGPARLEPGEHELRWDGRDRSRAQRIALSGSWTLSVQSAEREALERPPVTREVQVARPRYQPFWPWFGGSDVIPAGGLHRLGLDMAKRYDAAPMRRFANQGQFVSVLRQAAVGVMLTHGHDGQVGLGTWTNPQPILVSTDIQGKPFKDVHALFIYSCRSGVGPLPQTLLDAGVDVVVMSTETLLKVEADPYLGSLGFRLLGYGLPISRANADAAAFAQSVIWEPLNWAARAYLRDWKGIRSAQEGMQVWVAPGIEKATEKLVPARHGNSRN
ncbi:MAG: hypothetical protein KF878_18230 [Planctomycetes bacterium]|nr:hypothetical protein [Planctomycetota bacterium]